MPHDRIILPYNNEITSMPVLCLYDTYHRPTHGVQYADLFYDRFVLAADSQSTKPAQEDATDTCATHKRATVFSWQVYSQFLHENKCRIRWLD